MPLLGWSEKGNCLSSKETAEYLKKKKKKRRKYTIQYKKENIGATKTKDDLNNYKLAIHMSL